VQELGVDQKNEDKARANLSMGDAEA
jgi:hypothetical protein